MKYIIATLLIILILITFPKETSRMTTLSPHDTILAFGDSLTHGYGTRSDESYPYVLSRLSGFKVINAGINGETSREGLERLPDLLQDSSIKLMILCMGGNDIIQRKSYEQLKANLKTMIQMAKEKDIEVLLVSVPEFGMFGLSSLSLYKEVADEEGIPVIDSLLADILNDRSLKNDQVHPNAKGYKRMAEEIFRTLKKHGWTE